MMELARCGQYQSRFIGTLEIFKYGNELQKSLGSPRKSKVLRTQSFDEWNRAPKIRLTRASSACFDHNNFEEEYMKNLQQLMAFQYHEETVMTQSVDVGRSVIGRRNSEYDIGFGVMGACNSIAGNSISWTASVGNRGNDVGLPLSLKILKRKQCKERESNFTMNGRAKQSACCSIRRAFSSMILIIKELQTYALQMRQILLCEDLQEVLGMVHREMQASFVWLFQQVFSSTPTLMVSVMILLANFSVYSMGESVAVSAIPFVGSPPSAMSLVKEMPSKESKLIEAHPSWIKLSDQSFGNVSVPNILSFGDGIGGGGHKSVSIAGEAADGDLPYEGNSQNHAMFLEGNFVKSSTSLPKGGMPRTLGSETGEAEKENVNPSDQIAKDAELWQSFLKEFESESKGAIVSNAHLGHGTFQSLVAPISTNLEPDNYVCYDRTELLYQNVIGTDPNNALLLSNYAQFLHLVRHDNDRAEECFRLAMRSDSMDGEAIVRFANFLWAARGDLCGAEKTYLDAIDVDPRNPFYSSSYAHFLWHTGGAESSYSDNPTI